MLPKNLVRGQLFDHVRALMVDKPSLSRLCECFVKKAVFLEKPGCTSLGVSREH